MSLYATDIRQRGTLKCLMVAFEGKEKKKKTMPKAISITKDLAF